jgi:hypothetical protein
VIYAIISLVALAIGVALWLWRKGKKEAYGEAAQETIKNVRKSASVGNRVDAMSDADVDNGLSEWTKK